MHRQGQGAQALRVRRQGVGGNHRQRAARRTSELIVPVNVGAVRRTPTHTAYGLAVLLFHLLFMGRHPFAGRFHGVGEMPIEKAIAESRFAYARETRRTGARSSAAAAPSCSAASSAPRPRPWATFETLWTRYLAMADPGPPQPLPREEDWVPPPAIRRAWATRRLAARAAGFGVAFGALCAPASPVAAVAFAMVAVAVVLVLGLRTWMKRAKRAHVLDGSSSTYRPPFSTARMYSFSLIDSVCPRTNRA